MSEERLQEIKDSISLQYKVQEASDLHNFNIFTDEEQELVEEIERLNTIIDELKLCNSDYYNQICTLSSKLSLINKYINEDKNCVPKHIYDYINKILFDNYIKLGSDKE